MDSILTSIKKMLGIDEADTTFDVDIILYINSVLMVLNQIGIGPDAGFFITDKNQKWVDFIGDRKDLEPIKTYIYMKVRLMFDPPTSSFVLEAMKEQAQEMEWRLNVQIEKPAPVVVDGGVV